jgi:hypothetical protein
MVCQKAEESLLFLLAGRIPGGPSLDKNPFRSLGVSFDDLELRR